MGRHLYKQIHRCSIAGCEHVTTATRWPDPRNRWILGAELKDENENTIILNLCPEHVRSILGVKEEDFSALEKMECEVRESADRSLPV